MVVKATTQILLNLSKIISLQQFDFITLVILGFVFRVLSYTGLTKHLRRIHNAWYAKQECYGSPTSVVHLLMQRYEQQ